MKINRAVLNEIIAQAKNELPDESCGYLLANAEGIIDEDVDRSIRNLTSIGKDAMNATDDMVLEIMTHKSNC